MGQEIWRCVGSFIDLIIQTNWGQYPEFKWLVVAGVFQQCLFGACLCIPRWKQKTQSTTLNYRSRGRYSGRYKSITSENLHSVAWFPTMHSRCYGYHTTCCEWCQRNAVNWWTCSVPTKINIDWSNLRFKNLTFSQNHTTIKHVVVVPLYCSFVSMFWTELSMSGSWELYK